MFMIELMLEIPIGQINLVVLKWSEIIKINLDQ